ncbi:MAG TPA: ATP-binding protein [Marmoricola sp.]|nr:ATP-binding protein [Marmoricola sp.]
MTHPELGWFDRLAGDALRTQYRLAVVVVITSLVLTALISAVSVLWANDVLREQSEHAAALKGANAAIRQDMTDAETGLRGYGISGRESTLEMYLYAMSWLPEDQADLRALADGHPALERAVGRQDQAITTWLREYAEARVDRGEADGADDELFLRGSRLFDRFRSANEDVDAQIVRVVDEIDGDSRRVTFAALAVVVLVPLLAVGTIAVAIGRLGRSIIESLRNIAGVLERLRNGDTTARAEVTGPVEIRQIASGLNLLTVENQRASQIEADVMSSLESIERFRTDLVSTVSHELRTPLTSVTGYLELLQDQLHDDLDDDQAAMMGVIRRNLDRLNELITNLLALSRAEETPFEVEPVDLRTIAAEVAADLRLTATGRDIAVRSMQSASPVAVLGDRSQLTRVVQNLATNAVKFSSPGETVEVRVVQEGGEAVLEVVDEGIGIPAADLPGLGSRFYRASNAMKAEIAGTGLGLRIVQTIIDRHDGSLSVESIEGEGTTVTVRLPISRVAPDAPLGMSSGPGARADRD